MCKAHEQCRGLVAVNFGNSCLWKLSASFLLIQATVTCHYKKHETSISAAIDMPMFSSCNSNMSPKPEIINNDETKANDFQLPALQSKLSFFYRVGARHLLSIVLQFLRIFLTMTSFTLAHHLRTQHNNNACGDKPKKIQTRNVGVPSRYALIKKKHGSHTQQTRRCRTENLHTHRNESAMSQKWCPEWDDAARWF